MHVYPDVYVTLQQRMIIWQKLNNIYSQIKICSIMKISPVIILKFSYFTVTCKAFTNKSNRSDLIHYILYCSKTFYVSVTRYTSHLLYEAQKRFVHVYDKLSLICTVKYKVTDALVTSVRVFRHFPSKHLIQMLICSVYEYEFLQKSIIS